VKTGANDRGRSGMKKTITTASWDATLDTTSCNRYSNADLTITVRIGFKQINPPNGALAGTYHDYGDPNAPLRKIVKWGPGAWLHWRTQFVKSAASYWNGRFWLLNNFSEFSIFQIFTANSIWLERMPPWAITIPLLTWSGSINPKHGSAQMQAYLTI